MSIIESQIKNLIAAASKLSMQSGKLLDLTEIVKIITDKVRQLDGGPTMKLRPQYDSISLDDINKMFEDIKFDLDILYQALTESTAELFKIYNNADISYRAQRAQISRLKGLINELLLTTQNAEDNFYGVFDNLNTIDKLDINKSTSGIVDVSEGVALLPFAMPSAIRLPMTHLIGLTNGSITATTLDDRVVDGRNGAGSRFGFAFSNISSIWRYEVISRDKNGVKIAVTIPVSPDDTIARLTRVELSVISGIPITATVLGSLDNQNYKRFVETTDKSILPNTEKIAWDFPETPVRYIRLVFKKAQPDSSYTTSTRSTTISNPVLNPVSGGAGNQPNGFLYNFNISNIGFYRMGRMIDAIFHSKPLQPISSPEEPISQLSISVDEEVPSHTSIEYYVALANSRGGIESDFQVISPVDRGDSDAPKVLNFKNTIVDEIYFTGSYRGLQGSVVTEKSIDFYPIKTLGSEYKFGSCKLFRGAGLFSRTTNPNEISRTVKDSFADFSDGSRTVELYAYKTETAVPLNRLISNGTIAKTFLSLSKKIKNSPLAKRDILNDPYYTDDIEPGYAIAEVRHLRSLQRISNSPIKPTGGVVNVNGTQIPIASSWLGYSTSAGSIGVPILLDGQPIDILSTGPDKPILKAIIPGFEYVFREGIDYNIKRSDDDYFNNFGGWNPFPLHWRIVPVEPVTILIQSGSPLTGQYGNQTGQFIITGGNLPPIQFGSYNLTQNETLFLTYTIDPDITHRVTSVSYTSNEVELDGLLHIGAGDSIQVTYRFVPDSIVRDSVRVTQNPGTNEGRVFIQGVDYSVNVNDGTITKMQGGAITSLTSEVVYVDFVYKDLVDETENFSIWCYVESRDPLRFDYTLLDLKKASGEALLWTYAGGNSRTQDITNSTSITLSKGWHYFVVKSLSPDRFSDCGITKVLKMRSTTNEYLFLPYDRGGKFFTKMAAYRVPMRQVNFSGLKYGTLKSDHSKFAIDENTKTIYVNYPPGRTKDLYMTRINSLGMLQTIDFEEYSFIGTKTTTGVSNGTHVVLKARLSRSEGSNGGITPKLGSYTIRISY